MLRATEAGPAASVLYLFVMNPAVPQADYGVGKLLQEAFPLDEALELFEQYTASLAGAQSILNLRVVRDFAEPWTPPRTPAR